MKRKLTLLVALLVGVAAFAAGKAQLTFRSQTYDFGTIKANGGPVTAIYEFTNTGDAPLAISHVTNGGCGCTTPSYPKEPIRPGGKGVIKIHFNPTGRKGEVNRAVRVKSNGAKGKVTLQFSAVIIP